MLILGHRGVINDRIAQNSLRAFTEALKTADGFETDACISSDGEIFLIHEAKYADAEKGVEYALLEHLDAASAALVGKRRLNQMTGADIRRLRLQDGQPIPLLQQAIELVGGRSGTYLNIELKSHGVVEPVVALLKTALQKASITAEALLLSSFNHPTLHVARRELPAVKIGAIFVGPDQPTAKLFPWQPQDGASYTALTPAALKDKDLLNLQPDIFVMPETLLDKSTLAMIGADYPKAQLAAWVFTEKGDFDLANLVARLRRLPAGKIAAMIVDDPQSFNQAWRSC